jgi:hypothetical protein
MLKAIAGGGGAGARGGGSSARSAGRRGGSFRTVRTGGISTFATFSKSKY